MNNTIKILTLTTALLASNILFSQTKESTVEKAEKIDLVDMEATQGDNTDVDFRETLKGELALTKAQQGKVNEINAWTRGEVSSVKAKYKVNDEVYENRIRVIIQKRDAKLSEVLSLEQFALYMESKSDNIKYDTNYKSDDLKMKKQTDGTIKVKTEDGKFKIQEEEIIIKNDTDKTETKIEEDKVKFQDEGNDKKVKVKDDKVKVKSNEKKMKVKEDKVKMKKDDVKIKIDDSGNDSSKQK